MGFAAGYISCYWNAPSGIAQVSSAAVTTSGLYSVSTKKDANVVVPMPPLPEQVEILERVTAFNKLADAIERHRGDGARRQAHAGDPRESIHWRAGADRGGAGAAAGARLRAGIGPARAHSSRARWLPRATAKRRHAAGAPDRRKSRAASRKLLTGFHLAIGNAHRVDRRRHREQTTFASVRSRHARPASHVFGLSIAALAAS